MNRRRTGAEYEEQAARWLAQNGFELLERNFSCRQGEIDLVAREGACLVFVEVKYRRSSTAGHPAESVTRRKQRKIALAAGYYCLKHRILDTCPCRFDVITILGDEVEHIRNAFEYV